ncbi:HAD-IIIC family phosphatase [Clostridium tagluense]|uniref:HAD-IIIC family phosphatase n=1 Tax=Clostridium tagluense TaxID=360422 RepID=UPI001CF432CC|nr:HAD-IIIC family phosphatase [Clostridium tagluense]MCB2298653.1 HAD-IIIC family phosphatase [Clostridium tagluense]
MAIRKIKCVVWDLDNTVWDGILIQDQDVELRQNVINIIKTLDERGILQSICSKNEYQLAIKKLEEFNILDYFIYPQINWNPKSSGLRNIANAINIGMDTIAFIDDQDFEREEVSFNNSDVLCIDVADVDKILNMEEMKPRFVTEDSKNRRLLYLKDIKRNKVEEEFEGTKEEFLSSLNMVFTIGKVDHEDLKRAEELTVRTHQLNATGYTYSYEELDKLSRSKDYDVLIAQLEDKYGDYGKIGLALIEKKEGEWLIKLLLMSCRVVSRGVGSILLNYIIKKAKEANVRLLAEFMPTDRNRIMYITYKFSGFNEVEKKDGRIIFESNLINITPIANYIKVLEK